MYDVTWLHGLNAICTQRTHVCTLNVSLVIIMLLQHRNDYTDEYVFDDSTRKLI